MPYATSQTVLGIGKEATRGTGVAPTLYIPVRNPAPFDNYKMLEDKGLRGSAADTYNLVQGVRVGEFSWAGDVFPDVVGPLIQGVLGVDKITTGSVFTDVATVSGSNVITSTTAQFVTALDAGKTITGTGIPGATTISTVLSPTSVQLSANATATGTVTATILRSGEYTHQETLLNNSGTTGNQPASYTFVDFYSGLAGSHTRQWTGMQMSDLGFKFSGDGMAEYTAKASGNASTLIAAPTNTVDALLPQAGWQGVANFAGVANTLLVTSGEVTFKRATTPIQNMDGSQDPYRVWAGTLKLTGKMTCVFDGDSELLNYLNNTQGSCDIRFAQPATGHSLGFRFSVCAFKAAKIMRSKEYVETDIDWEALPNATDAAVGSGAGVSHCVATVMNTAAAAY